MDLDIKNAHPAILHTFAKRKNIKTQELSRYVENRGRYLEELSETYEIENPKKHILMLLNFTEREFQNLSQLHPLFNELKNTPEYRYCLGQKDSKDVEKNESSLCYSSKNLVLGQKVLPDAFRFYF